MWGRGVSGAVLSVRGTAVHGAFFAGGGDERSAAQPLICGQLLMRSTSWRRVHHGQSL